MAEDQLHPDRRADLDAIKRMIPHRDPFLLIDSVEEIRHNEELCMSCSACVPHCTTGALALDRKTRLVSHDPERCVVCHSCVDACPYRAVEVADR